MKYLLPLFALIGLLSCSETSKYHDCHLSYEQEEINDTIASVEENLELFCANYGVKPIKNSKMEAFRIILHPSLYPATNAFLFEQRENGAFITYQRIPHDSTTQIVKREFEIAEDEWQYIKYLICNFDFWTTKPVKTVLALDGYSLILEANFPSGNKSDKFIHRTVYRTSPSYSDNMLRLYENLTLMYEQLEPYELRQSEDY